MDPEDTPDLLVYQVCQGADAALILYQYGYIVCKIRSGEIPALLSLIGDGESSQYTVNIAGIQKLGSGSCGYGGELYIHAKALCDLLSQADLQSGILTGQGILEAKAYYCIFNCRLSIHHGLRLPVRLLPARRLLQELPLLFL